MCPALRRGTTHRPLPRRHRPPEHRQRIDPARIGAMGTSYGGYTVARLAFTDKRVKAVVSHCGLIHEALNRGPATIKSLPPVTRAALAARYNVPVSDTEQLGRVARRSSLANQKLVGTIRTNTSILAINTADDPIAPVSDLKRLAASSTDGKVVVTSGSGHCEPFDESYEAATSWLKRKL
ncbi:alpha/beta hydrolase [Nonomuraea diastatica]|uniref:Alpha/beta hydrolase n=1 Tax=Nonomuraea diastatica TaxID=1848329 RepID=A0A4R4VUS9_9ACTN|nr:alpha/beta hydrolase [Nonomuraea diastatica]TDD08017.1 alpha/beta hydrolase [Nonomuraea diastatica]